MVGSTLSFLNLEVSEIISSIVLWSSFQSKMTTPFPLSGFVITISLFFLSFAKHDVDVVYVEKVFNCRSENLQGARDAVLSDFCFPQI